MSHLNYETAHLLGSPGYEEALGQEAPLQLLSSAPLHSGLVSPDNFALAHKGRTALLSFSPSQRNEVFFRKGK